MVDQGEQRPVSARFVRVLAYLIPPVSSLFVLFMEREDRQLKFHAWQSFLLGCAFYLLLVSLGLLSMGASFVAGFLGDFIDILTARILLASFGLWFYFLYRVYKDTLRQIPGFGKTAAKWAGLGN